MRLDRVKLDAMSDIFRKMVDEATQSGPSVIRMILPTSPTDRVQIFLRRRENVFYLAIRRPKGNEDPREIQALARIMGLTPTAIYTAKGRQKRAGFLGQRSYLVAECVLSSEMNYGQQNSVRLGDFGPNGAHLAQQQ